MVPGLLGRKIGMTQIFNEDGDRIPVTVIETGPCVVFAVKTVEKDGYNAIQIGFSDTKENRVKKPQREYLKAKKLPFKKFVREIRYEDVPDVKVGDTLTNSIFQTGDYLDIRGISKGKGFQGGMKRHGWMGGTETHGSMSHRAPGSIGASSFPSRVFKGQRMSGHMGHDTKTIQNLEVLEVNTEDNTIAVKGSVPGANNGYLIVRFALKKELAPRVEPEKGAEDAGEQEKEGSKE